MKLDITDFRLLNGEFYQSVPDDLVIDCVGHKTSQFNNVTDPVNGALVYLNTERRAMLRVPQYIDDFNLPDWLMKHRDKMKLLVTEKPITNLKVPIPQFIVPDTWEFYKEVAAYIRQRYFGNVITITGSVGKSTTRLMAVTMLKALNHQVVTNYGNENVRIVTVPLLTNVVRNPDELVAEISINALSDLDRKDGPVSRLYKANVAVITQIGGAHLSDIQNAKDPLMFLAGRKARIFEGINADSCAIINRDMEPRIYDYVKMMAKKKTKHVFSYSENDKAADAFVVEQVEFRDYSIVTINVMGEVQQVKLTMPGTGIIMDLLGACLILKSLNIDLPDLTTLFVGFQALNSELKFHELHLPSGSSTLVDDTHGSTIHSVKNVLSVFKRRGQFYQGRKVLIMETGEDLGKVADINLQFKEPILDSGIDMVIGYRDERIKSLVSALDDAIETRFYDKLLTLEQFVKELPADSLVIVKSSDGRKYGSDLWTLPRRLMFLNKERT